MPPTKPDKWRQYAGGLETGQAGPGFAPFDQYHDLTARGVGLKVLTGHGAAIDTTSAAGKLVFGIFAALTEFERELHPHRGSSQQKSIALGFWAIQNSLGCVLSGDKSALKTYFKSKFAFIESICLQTQFKLQRH